MDIKDKIDLIEKLTGEVKEVRDSCDHEFGDIKTKKVKYQAEKFVKMIGRPGYHQYPEYEMVEKEKKVRFYVCKKCQLVRQDNVFADIVSFNRRSSYCE